MHEALPWIVGLQLVVTFGLALLVFGLARQVGILHERVAPMGALTSDRGPEVGARAPGLRLTTLDGRELALGGAAPNGRSRLLLFVAPTCPVCKKLLPIARSVADAERLEVVLVGDGALDAQRAMIREFGLERLAYVSSAEAGLAFQVGKLPYAVLIDADGVIRAKGLVNSREHLESLIVAEETGFGTIQAYLAARAASAETPAAARRSHEAEKT